MTAFLFLLLPAPFLGVFVWLYHPNAADGVRANILRAAILTATNAILSLDSIKPLPPGNPFRVGPRLDSAFDYFIYFGCAITPKWKVNFPAGHQVSLQPGAGCDYSGNSMNIVAVGQ